MDMQKLTRFFMWCSIINGAILVLSVIGIVLGPDFGLSLQSKLFHITRETLNLALYLYLGVFKIAWLVLNVTPYVALRIVWKSSLP
jgi:hypothetical protein